ncbi:hypothetical protein BGX21_000072 [Mortierella sp. AD011]|nr:hypothetical protein BGX20_011570 [Mortierella sp. AD010]KAF9389544.1 hypothetical protein BGX21_000072 [Mortierella sp. AD011]
MAASHKFVLYYHRFCPFSARAVLAMAETKQPHEAISIDINTPRPDWYLKEVNPYGQVPALKIDEKDIVLDSLIVSEYLSDLHPEAGLFPADPLQRAQTRYLIQHWGARTQPAQHKATFSLDPSDASSRHQDYIAELEKVNNLLVNAHKTSEPGLDGNGPYFLGSRFTFADLALASFLTRVPLVEVFQGKLGFKFPTKEENQNLARFIEWKDAVISRESVVEKLPSKKELIEVYEKNLK